MYECIGSITRKGRKACASTEISRRYSQNQRRRALARFEAVRFEEDRFDDARSELDRREVVFLAADFFAPLRLRVVFFAAVFFVALLRVFLDAVFFLPGFAGISAPERRASLKPIAIACLGFFTLPPRPLSNS